MFSCFADIYTMHARRRRGHIKEGVADSTNQRAPRITVHALARANVRVYARTAPSTMAKHARASCGAKSRGKPLIIVVSSAGGGVAGATAAEAQPVQEQASNVTDCVAQVRK